MNKTLVCISGPTAVGKTAMAIRVANHFRTEIVSADSRQFYAEMNIGTAKPTASELGAAPHHFIGHIPVTRLYSAGDFERDAMALLDKLFSEHDIVVMVGGSGLYLKAVCEGLDEMPMANLQLRDELRALFAEGGIEALQQKLISIAPDKVPSMDIRNTQRVMRAIEIAEQEKASPSPAPPKAERPFSILHIGLDLPRAELYERINTRVDHMMGDGLLDEVKALLPLRHENALQTVGYSELFEYLDGSRSLAEAVNLVKQHTRNFAKRQLTWFRRNAAATWFHPSDAEAVIHHIETATGQVA